LIEDVNSGWVAWQESIVAYACPHVSKPSLPPWDPESQAAISAVREATGESSFWKNLSIHFSSETHSEVVSSDNVASIKSIGMFASALKIRRIPNLQLLVQLLEDESFASLQTLIEELIQNPDQNKQRGAAEFLAGLLNGKTFFLCTTLFSKNIGAKHWPMHSQKVLWDWAMPLIKTTFGSRIKTDTLPVWMSFLEVRSPRLHVPPYSDTVSSICFINEILVDIKLSSTTLCRSSTLLITTANRHSMPSKRCAFSGPSMRSRTGNSLGG
jgi:proteasome activator subunit 4